MEQTVLDYSPYNLHACQKNKCICDNNGKLDIAKLDILILSDYTSNSIFRTTWISFKGCIDQFDTMHDKIKCSNCKELLLDFYKSAYIRAKEMQVRLKEYFSFDKDKECIIKCNVNELIDQFLIILSSHVNMI